ncbi:MAG: hypothetical protein M3Y33_19085, partial [Actinomycetota bacterium]|nr:hypothetical protein [Actinomycetota bacterium]
GWCAPAICAAAWCALFAGLQLFWGFGGTTGLASSAGRDLAARRPASFVIVGLFGVAALLLLGIAVIAIASSARLPGRPGRAARVLVAVAGTGLLIRGVALEVLLAADAGGLRAAPPRRSRAR